MPGSGDVQVTLVKKTLYQILSSSSCRVHCFFLLGASGYLGSAFLALRLVFIPLATVL